MQFQVTGVSKLTGQDCNVVIDAATPSAAEEQAADMNIMVERIDAVSIAGPQPAIRQPSSMIDPIEAGDLKALDTQIKLAAWLAGGGLLLLALSPLFKWVSIGSGGIIGVYGDGKIVLGVTVIAIVAYVVVIVKRKWFMPVFLGIQAWGTLAVFWMGALMWKVGFILDSPDLGDNLFAFLLATQVGAGVGLYLGLVGGLAIAGALGFIAVRRLPAAGNLNRYYATQGMSCVLGILLAFLVGPSQPIAEPSSPTASAEVASAEPIIKGVELEPSLAGKRFIKKQFEEVISFDVYWTIKKLKKPVRAVKGTLHVMDLFGETRLTSDLTINRTIDTEGRFMEEYSLDYNEFRDSHNWVRYTKREDMKVKFEMEAVIYQDGSVETIQQ